MLEEKILDGYDDITKGLISYAIFDTTCTTVIAMVIKSVPTATIENNPDLKINIFPNPAVTHFTLKENSKFTHLELFDLQGRKQLTVLLREGDNRVDVAHLQAGAYLCRLAGHRVNAAYNLMIKQ